MPGGKGKINEYYESLTPEQRKELVTKGGKAQKKHKSKTIREIAKIINDAPAQKKAQKALQELGIDDENMTNAAMIAAAVFRAAFNGDMRAIEKWEQYIGQSDETRKDLEIRLLKARISQLEAGQGSGAVDDDIRRQIDDLVKDIEPIKDSDSGNSERDN